MFGSSSRLVGGGISATLLFLCLCQQLVAVESVQHQRRKLAPNENIHQYLQNENKAGNMRPKFTLVSEMKVDHEEGTFTSAVPSQYEINLVQATSAVTSGTTYSMYGGPHYPVGNLGVQFLVQDRTVQNGDGTASMMVEKPTTFALISVDEHTGAVNGIAKKQGEHAMQIQQNTDTGTAAVASPANDFEPPKDYKCQVTHRGNGRDLMSESNSEHGHAHQHSHAHDDSHAHEDNHGHGHLFSEHDVDNLMNGVPQLDHSNKQHKKNRAPEFSTSEQSGGFPEVPKHQVDLYIEIDSEFIALNNGNITDAWRYVNTLVTAASTIYEAEVSTRLNVAHMGVTDHYDKYDKNTDSAVVLDEMKRLYANNDTHWQGINLHHAVLGNKLMGGIAFIKSLCSQQYGYGISPNMRGTFLTLDWSTVWDVSVLAHEIGHNFGAYHTFDRNAFKPPVDRCKIRSQDVSTCPADTVLEGAATIMSYCDTCPGADVATLAYSFGGDFVGDDPSDLNGWRNNPSLLGTFNREPRRVPKTMYDHVSSVGTCVEPDFECKEDSYCNDHKLCTVDTCNQVSGQCEHELLPNCCGNGICEAGEAACGTSVCQNFSRSCSSDCGPFNLETKKCTNCNAKRGRGNGVMFDIQSTSDDIVLINRIIFRHTQTEASTITIYTLDGSYINKAISPEEWTVASTTDISIGGRKGGYYAVEMPDSVRFAISAKSTRAFYIASTGKLISGYHEDGVDTLAIDNALRIEGPARIVGSEFGGGVKGSWDGKINYSIYPNPVEP